MKTWIRSALVLVAVGVVGSTACSSGTTEDPDTTTDAGTTGGTDGGTTETPDAGTNENTPPPRRKLGATESLTNTIVVGFTNPPCTGACGHVVTTETYPKGATFTQLPQVRDPATGDLYVSVTRAREVTSNGNVSNDTQYLAFSLPRDSKGTVACSGGTSTARIYAGTNQAVSASVLASTCSFDVLENSATRLKIEVKSNILFGTDGGWGLAPGILDIPLVAWTAMPDREQAEDFTVPVTFGDGTHVNGDKNPRAFVFEGQIAVTVTAAVPNLGNGALDVRVPVDALGFIPCHKDSGSSVGVSFLAGTQIVAFSSAGAPSGCYLMVLQNDATGLVLNNQGPIPMPAALGGEGAIAINSLSINAKLKAK